MANVRFLSLLSLATLAACGPAPDNPDNIPVMGKWADEGKLMSVKVGGTAVDAKDVPGIAALKSKIGGRKEFCGEPRFRTKEEFQEAINENNPAGCEIQSVEGSGKYTRAKGVCTGFKMPGVDGRGTLDGRTQMAPDKVIYDMTVNVFVKDKATGEGAAVSLDVRRTMTRLGDC